MNNKSLRRFAGSAKLENNQRHMKIKARVIQLLHANSFSGMDRKDHINHLMKFYEIVESPGVSDNEEENIYLMIFPHSLIRCAKDWYLDQPTTTMTNWNTPKDKFIKRLLPYRRIQDGKTTIVVCTQGSNETLCEA